MAGWKPALRLARRDALRHKGRSILVLVMIALPVLAVSAADVVYLTNDVNSVESLDRRLGSADARITAAGRRRPGAPGLRPDEGRAGRGLRRRGRPGRRSRRSGSTLGRDVPATEIREGACASTPTAAWSTSRPTELDVASPLVEGLFELTSGRWPASDGEVVVNAALADKGFAVGCRADRLDEGPHHDGRRHRRVHDLAATTRASCPGSAVSASTPHGQHRLAGRRRARVLGRGAEPSTRSARSCCRAPSSRTRRPTPSCPLRSVSTQSEVDSAWIAVIVLVVVMALLEVVLLAGPAFAVGAGGRRGPWR